MNNKLRAIITLLFFTLFAVSAAEASFFDALKKSVEDVSNTVEDVVEQTQEALDSIPGSEKDKAESEPEARKEAEPTNSSNPTSSNSNKSSATLNRTAPGGKIESRTHKDDFFDYCVGRRDNAGYCKCLMPEVEKTVSKRKALIEKLIEGEDRMPKQAIKLLLTKRLAKDEAEILADCEVMRAHENKTISDHEFDKTFTGQKRKNGFYEGRLRKRICFDSEKKKQNLALYKSKDYEFVNPGSIMSGGNQCSRDYLK